MELVGRSHEAYVQLIDYGLKEPQQFFHAGTGETAAMHDRLCLGFDAGASYLRPIGDPAGRLPQWCNDLLDSSLHDDGSEPGRIVLFRRSTDVSVFADTLVGRIIVVGFSHASMVGEYRSEIYRHDMPPNN